MVLGVEELEAIQLKDRLAWTKSMRAEMGLTRPTFQSMLQFAKEEIALA